MKAATITVAVSIFLGALAFILRYLVPIFPAENVHQQTVLFRLTLIQHAAILTIALIGFLTGLRQRKTIPVILAVAMVVAYGLATHDKRSSVYIRRSVAPGTSSKYKFSNDWVSPHENNWREVLAEFKGKPDVHALEIGTFEGRSAIWFLENILTHPKSSITCIDIWLDSHRQTKNFEHTFDSNVLAYGNPKKIIKLKGRSDERLPGMKAESFDFIYIDGSHLSHDVLTDAVMSWRLLKPGGYMIFDDYNWWLFRDRLRPYESATAGIDAFVEVFDPYIDVLRRETQLVLRKRRKPKSLVAYPIVRSAVLGVQHAITPSP